MAIGFSLASNISSTTLIGLVEAYDGGLFISNYEWMATIVLVFFVLVFVPIFLRSRISTIPEFLEQRFGRASRRYFSGLTIITNILVDTAGSLYAGAVVLQLFFPDLDMTTTCIVLAVIAGIYTAAGGLAAVVYTDIIQAVVLLLGSCLMTYFVFAHPAIDFSWTALTEGVNDLKVLGHQSDPSSALGSPPAVARHPDRRTDPRLLFLGHKPVHRTARAGCKER